MQNDASQDTRLHNPFEHVELPEQALSSHHHIVRSENDTETRDFEPPHIPDGLSNIFSRWGWLTPECEGRSHSRRTLSDQGSLEPTTPSHPQETGLYAFESDQTQRTATRKNKTEGKSPTSFEEEYGKFNKVLHFDDSNTVQLYAKKVPASDLTSSPEASSPSHMLARLRRNSISNTIRELYAVKVFRHAPKTLLSLPSSLQSGTPTVSLCHPNIVPLLDILYNKQNNLCLVMPYYAGGNLHTFLAHKVKLTENVPAEEADCLTIQMLRAVAFLHENNIAHGDIKPEHVLLTAQGAVKLGGFGEDPDAIREIFQLSHGSSRTSSFAVSSPKSASAQKHAPNFCIRTRVSDSSKPYLPPERFPGHPASHRESYTHQDVSDAKAGDIWACGIIYMFLRSGQLLWQSAQRTSPHKFFAEYLRCRMEEDGYNSIQVLGNRCRNVVYAMLHPDLGSRITAAEILRSEWALGVAVCEVGEKGL